MTSQVSANLVALYKIGIQGKHAAMLAGLSWVTPSYIRAMHARWHKEGLAARRNGLNANVASRKKRLLVHRMLNAEAVLPASISGLGGLPLRVGGEPLCCFADSPIR